MRTFSQFMLLVCIAQVAILNCPSFGAQLSSDVTSVIEKCHNKLDFKTIAEFLQFIETYKTVIADTNDHPNGNKWVEKCWSEKEAILALGELVKNYDRKRACKYSNINQLEEFAKKFILHNKRTITLRFFTLFGVNIAIKCKANLMANLRQADMEVDQLDFIYSMASPSGWSTLVNEYTKKSMKFGSTSNVGGSLINKIAKLIPGLKLIDQLDYMNFNHALNVKSIEKEFGSYKVEQQQVHVELRESVSKIIESCKNLDQFYLNLILSLSKLTEIGLMTDYLNEEYEFSHLLHKWLAAASFCQLIVRVQIIGDNSSTPEQSFNFEIIHDDNELISRRKLYSYVVEFDEITAEALKQVWQASVPDGKWCQKNEAMFTAGAADSFAKRRLIQFIKGLEQDYLRALKSNEQ